MVATKALGGVQFALGTLVGLAIMVIALYYFLADGPTMIAAVLELSPLDARYEQELLERFGDVSRAVVVATLLSALVQGALAGIGYYFALPTRRRSSCSRPSRWLRRWYRSSVRPQRWIGVCGYIYFYGERIVDGATVQGDPKTAIILAIYCTVIVSGIDNIIKPFILHGQSKLHPLLALLSILGGIQVLGPVGILVGPMLVSFLQALAQHAAQGARFVQRPRRGGFDAASRRRRRSNSTGGRKCDNWRSRRRIGAPSRPGAKIDAGNASGVSGVFRPPRSARFDCRDLSR